MKIFRTDVTKFVGTIITELKETDDSMPHLEKPMTSDLLSKQKRYPWCQECLMLVDDSSAHYHLNNYNGLIRRSLLYETLQQTSGQHYDNLYRTTPMTRCCQVIREADKCTKQWQNSMIGHTLQARYTATWKSAHTVRSTDDIRLINAY